MMQNGDIVVVNFTGKVHFSFSVTRDFEFTEVVEMYTNDGEKMIVPSKYVTIVDSQSKVSDNATS
jgi:hypothetical protein